MAPTVTIESGRPINAITGGDENRTMTWPLTARPLGLPRNALRLPMTATLDVRILKYFPIKPHGKLDVVVEVFNALNRTNVTAINSVFGADAAPLPSFGRPITAAAARQVQLSIDFEF
jgi:hypothetical protein